MFNWLRRKGVLKPLPELSAEHAWEWVQKMYAHDQPDDRIIARALQDLNERLSKKEKR